MLWLRRWNILDFGTCPMILSLRDYLLSKILGLGGGFLSLTLAFTFLFLHILNLDNDLTRAPGNFS